MIYFKNIEIDENTFPNNYYFFFYRFEICLKDRTNHRK